MRDNQTKNPSRGKVRTHLNSLALLVWFAVFLVIAAAISFTRPPHALPASAPETTFSAERALVYIKAIAQVPHPIGSSQQAAVHAYLMEELTTLGLHPRTYSAVGVESRGRNINAGRVNNIVGRLPGSASSRAILLMAHYDSTRHAPGAADDGASVAAILEAIRAIRADGGLKNDLIVLFTDGEEAGLLGAEAFSHGSPLLKDVGLILNFEARGNQGPSLLFETTEGNDRLIEEVQKADREVMGSSFFYNLYRLLPNDTDLTVLKHLGIPGLNFAFGNRLGHYHTSLDNIENLSSDSLQHQGTYVLLLAKHFGRIDLTKLPAHTDQVFFNLFAKQLITYPQKWTLWGELVLTILSGILLIFALRNRQLHLRLVVLAALVMVASLICLPLALAAAWAVLSLGFRVPVLLGDTPSNNFLLIGLVSLGTALGLWVWKRLCRTHDLATLTCSALICLLIATWLLLFTVPLGTYLLQWPLFLFVLAMPVILSRRGTLNHLYGWAILPAVICVLLLVAPLLYFIYIFLTIGYLVAVVTGILIVVTLMIATGLVPVAVPATANRLVPLAFLAGGIACLLYGSSLSHYNNLSPKMDSLNYSLEADQQKAAWLSYDRSPDSWTQLTLPASSRRWQPMPDYLVGETSSVWTAPAPLEPLAAPVVEMQVTHSSASLWNLHLTVASQRDSGLIYVAFGPSAQILAAEIDGRNIPLTLDASRKPGLSKLSLYGWGQEKATVSLQIASIPPPVMWIADSSAGLPTQVPPRPGEFVASFRSDVTLVSRRFDLATK